MGNYSRVIPRDLFNEANLLKCLGQVYLNLEQLNIEGVELVGDRIEDGFDIVQDEADGSLSCHNVLLKVQNGYYEFRRPLNSREPWPLYMLGPIEDTPVFTNTGHFSDQMLIFLNSMTS